MHTLVHQLQHMQQLISQHAFTPVLHQSSTILPTPALMRPQDRNFNTNLPRETVRTFFPPITASHRATQRSFKSTIRGRWGALHVCIAWKIYYHKHLKKMQEMHSSQQEQTPKFPANRLSDSSQQKELYQPSTSPYLDSSSGFPACETGKTAGNTAHSKSSLSDHHTSSPASSQSRGNKREKLNCEEQDQHSNLHQKPDEKDKHQICQSDSTKDLTHKDKFRDLKVTPELDGRHTGSLDRKRQLECEGYNKAKRMKQGIVDSPPGSSQTLQYDPFPFVTTHGHPSSHNIQVQHLNTSDLSFLYPNSIRFNVSYPGTELHPYQTAPWENMRDKHERMGLLFRKHALKDYSLKACKAIRNPLVGRGFTPPLYFLRGRETLMPREVPSAVQMSEASYWLSSNTVLGP